jgi:uncharacterized 2Fe-2S/4Fe-4S cluster protein (DUF4445 family)
VGNTALLGAKQSLFEDDDYGELRSRIQHVPLGADSDFQEEFVTSMAFPRKELGATDSVKCTQ